MMSISFKAINEAIINFRADLLRVKLYLVSVEKRIHALENPPITSGYSHVVNDVQNPLASTTLTTATAGVLDAP